MMSLTIIYIIHYYNIIHVYTYTYREINIIVVGASNSRNHRHCWLSLFLIKAFKLLPDLQTFQILHAFCNYESVNLIFILTFNILKVNRPEKSLVIGTS